MAKHNREKEIIRIVVSNQIDGLGLQSFRVQG